MRWFALVAVLGIATACFVVHQTTTSAAGAQATMVRRPDAPRGVRSVALDGAALRSSQLRAVIATRPGAPASAEQLRRDREAMERTLADLGYLAARVAPAVVTLDAVGEVYVSFEVEQGRMFRIRNVTVTGAGRDAAVVTLTAGDDAVRGRIERARLALAEALARRGRPAGVTLSVHTDLAAAAVDVVLATR